MMKSPSWRVLIATLLLLAINPLQAKEKKSEGPTSPAPSAKAGDPPPGGAMALTVPQAQAILTNAIKNIYVGTVRWKFQRWHGETIFDAVTDVDVSSGGFSLKGSLSDRSGNRFCDYMRVRFRRLDSYIGVCHELSDSCPKADCYTAGKLPVPECGQRHRRLHWADEVFAQQYVDAYNRLVFAAHVEAPAAFIAMAKAWRENPVKPPLDPKADRHWILAENAIKEKNFDAAAEHYESALEIQPAWPTGWFNLAMIYGEMKQYVDAADAMKHYLELVPDAPDAKSAREQTIIWEDKKSTDPTKIKAPDDCTPREPPDGT